MRNQTFSSSKTVFLVISYAYWHHLGRENVVSFTNVFSKGTEYYLSEIGDGSVVRFSPSAPTECVCLSCNSRRNSTNVLNISFVNNAMWSVPSLITGFIYFIFKKRFKPRNYSALSTRQLPTESQGYNFFKIMVPRQQEVVLGVQWH